MKSDDRAIKTYTVEVDYTSDNTKITWKLNGKTHCEHGPAIWWQDGTYDFFLNDANYTRAEWETLTSRRWNLKTKRSTRVEPSTLPTPEKVFLVTEFRKIGSFNFKRKPLCTFDCMLKMDEFIIENETDEVWYEWEEIDKK